MQNLLIPFVSYTWNSSCPCLNFLNHVKYHVTNQGSQVTQTLQYLGIKSRMVLNIFGLRIESIRAPLDLKFFWGLQV
jgi:hypothetical protein